MVERIEELCCGISEEAMMHHCAFLVDGRIVEFEIVDLYHAKVHADKGLDLTQAIDCFRFYAYHVHHFSDEAGEVIAEFEPVKMTQVKIADLKVSQFYIDEKKLDNILRWIAGKEIAIPVAKGDDGWVVLDGHTRLKALLTLGIETVWVYEDESDPSIFDFMYEACRRGIYHVDDMILCPHEEYEICWYQYCREFFMKKKKIGFIGCGNMGGAILEGLLQNGFSNENIYVHTATRTALIEQKYKVHACNSNAEVAAQADWLILAVKPYMVALVLEEVKQILKEEQIIISVAAGLSLSDLESLTSNHQKIMCAMPNVPVQVGMGMTALCHNENCTADEVSMVSDLFRCVGECEVVSQKLLDTSICVSGSSPAYVFMLISAMMDGAIREGMNANQAKIFAAQAVMGSAKMVLESEKHPEQLKLEVCSPSGTTIEAVAALEEYGFRNAVLKAMEKCQKRLREMKD